MDIIICKTCKNNTFEESWNNGPLICISCGAVDDFEYISKVVPNKNNPNTHSVLNTSKDVQSINKNER